MNPVSLKTVFRHFATAWDQRDQQQGWVFSGCAPTAGAGLQVTVASGVVMVNASGARTAFAGASISLTAADATNPRVDIVYINSAGTLAKTDGTAAATDPVPSADWPAGSAPIAIVFVAPGATTITGDTYIFDVRAIYKTPMTTLLDLIVGSTAGFPIRLAGGSALQVLRVNAGATALEWVVGASGGTPALVLGTANTPGAAGTFIRTDDTLLVFDATTPAAVAYVGAAGAATVAPRRDHAHAVALTNSQSLIASNVASTNTASTWIDITSLSLAAGTWKIDVFAEFTVVGAAAEATAFRAYDDTGAATLKSKGHYAITAGNFYAFHDSVIVTLAATSTVKFQFYYLSGGAGNGITIQAASNVVNVGNNVSGMNAVRIA